jgi:hypothetical protein
MKEEVILEIQTRLDTNEEKYLEIYVHHRRGRMDHTHQLLTEQFWGKLAGWKMNLLSHAGRKVLTKSVLISTSVYM